MTFRPARPRYDLALHVAVFCLIIVAMVYAMIQVAFLLSAQHCDAMGQVLNLPTRWSYSTECVVQVDGRWYPLNWFRGVKP